MPKGDHPAEFEQYVLLALLRLGDDAYGVTIRQEIEARTGREVSMGAVYATLGRLADKGWATSWTSDPEPVRGGRSRRHWEPTPEGQEALGNALSMLDRMTEGLTLETRE